MMTSVRRELIALVAVGPLACTFGSAGGSGLAGDATGSSGSGEGSAAAAGSTSSTEGSGGADRGEGPQPTAGRNDGTGASSTTGDGGLADTTAAGSSSSDGDGGTFVLCDPADPELRACYDFAGVGGGTLTDLSSHGNHGTALGVAVEAGPFGEAARFSVDAEVAVPDSASLDITLPFSFEAWIWIDALPGSGRQGIIDKNGQYSLLVFAATGLRCGGGQALAFSPNVPLGQWVHVACVHDGTEHAIWVDGQLVASEPGTTPANTANTGPTAIGDTSPLFEEPLAGMIGAVRVWGVALSPNQIAAAAATAR